MFCAPMCGRFVRAGFQSRRGNTSDIPRQLIRRRGTQSHTDRRRWRHMTGVVDVQTCALLSRTCVTDTAAYAETHTSPSTMRLYFTGAAFLSQSKHAPYFLTSIDYSICMYEYKFHRRHQLNKIQGEELHPTDSPPTPPFHHDTLVLVPG